MTKIVSFDIWDTLIKRKCHPEEVKLFTMKYLLLKYYNDIKDEYKDIYKLLNLRNEIETKIRQENAEKGKDQECTIEETFIRLQKAIINKEIPDISQELLKVEIDFEKSVIYVNEEVLPILEKYKDIKKYCISDFYMGKESLREILESVDMYKYFEDIFSSADMLLNKISGRLYQYVEEKLQVKPEEHIHVGDNPYCDIEVAKKQGIQTIEMRKYANYDFAPQERRTFNFDFESIKVKDPKNNSDELYNLGVEISPLLYFFVENIIEYAIKNKIDTIYYQTREGETFIKIHELIKQNNIYGMEMPDCKLLEVSRVATFAPSLKEFTIAELLKLWSQYRCQSMKSLFKTLNIDINNYMNYLGKYDIDPKEEIWEPWFNLKIQNLFNDENFKEQIEKEIGEKRKELIQFFAKKGINNDDKSILIVDMGWRGTIQDNIAYIYPNKKIGGYYYALYDFYNYQPKNTYKIPYIKNREITYEYISPMLTVFEMLFNTESGSVIGYKNGEAIRKVKKEEYETVKNVTSYIQKGMMEGSKLINNYMKNHPYLNYEFDNYIYNIIMELKKHPNKTLVEAYYSLVHNDTFGTGKYVDKRGRLSGLSRFNVIKVRNQLRKEMWKEAYIIHNNIGYMNILTKTKSIIRKLLGKG